MAYGKYKIFTGAILPLVMLFSSHPVFAREITPFQTLNQSPLAQIFAMLSSPRGPWAQQSSGGSAYG